MVASHSSATSTFGNQIEDNLFRKLCHFIYDEYGIVLNESKRALVIHRITKRISRLHFTSIDEYLNYIFSNQGAVERQDLGSILSTNKTYFFREEQHFDFISNLIQNLENDTFLNVWSAGCSSGEEVFTLAMTILESRIKASVKVDYRIWGTDISIEALMKAQTRLFPEESLWTTPDFFKKKYFTRHKNSKEELFELNKELFYKVSFEVHNLVKETLFQSGRFEIIICRNVLIYFDQKTRLKVVRRLYDQLKPGGFLILGLTEGSIGHSLKLKQVAPSIFQKT